MADLPSVVLLDPIYNPTLVAAKLVLPVGAVFWVNPTTSGITTADGVAAALGFGTWQKVTFTSSTLTPLAAWQRTK